MNERLNSLLQILERNRDHRSTQGAEWTHSGQRGQPTPDGGVVFIGDRKNHSHKSSTKIGQTQLRGADQAKANVTKRAAMMNA